MTRWCASTAVTTSNFGLAMAADAGGQCAAMPIKAEDLRCGSANGFQCPGLYNPQDIVDFSSLPQPKELPRVRKAAHLLDAAYVGKFEEAVRRMKALPHDDPRSFERQADIHEAYCANHYKVVPAGGGPETVFDVHHSSIFAPWHRMYLYFFEGILGDLIGDPTFGLPYWNWDTPEGMMMPSIFANESSPLYDAKRNPRRVRAVIDLNLSPGSKDGLPTCTDDHVCLIDNNLYTLYRQMIVETPKQFYGGKFYNVELDDEGKQNHKITGSLENGAHNSAHIWLGDPCQKNQDMGDLSTAARDPIFYSNHSNVDRMWHIYITKLGGGFLPYKEWLDTSFVFYDAQKRPVRITVSDVLDVGKLGYMFEESGKLPWIGKRPKPAANIQRHHGLKGTQTNSSYPMTLKKGEPQYLRLERLEKSRAGGGSSKKAPEALVVDVTIDPCKYVKFDVLVNVPKGQEKKVGPQNSEFAGSFTQVPHGGGLEMKTRMVSYQFALRELLEDLKCGKDNQLDITLVLVEGDKVLIDDARIEVL
ncbi:hypothetical protein VPH35_075776 [Triticum aestivum]|uniref:(+)-larreatricin hydroxylase, chloroplastic-like n=1 Tax=Triticum aestivum TaxID=4565 RepID=UPI001D01CC17|nr:(+)-larreatricin hydroxylase, chloroplastic-like [Triticum aestivum]